MCHFAPDPRRDTRVILGLLACLYTAYSQYHDGQGRMVEFVKVPKDLPRHKAYSFTGISSEDLNDLYPKMALWPIEASWETSTRTLRTILRSMSTSKCYTRGHSCTRIAS